MERFSVRHMYKAMQGKFQKVSWRKLVSNNHGLPKWIFILRLEIQDRLATKERLARWESLQTKYAHSQLLHWQGIQRTKKDWREELKWIEKVAKGKSRGAAICRMVLAAAVYHIWQERNNVIFQKKRRSTNVILRLIIQEIHVRAKMFPRLDRCMIALNWYPDIV
ncbi:uncharacterized protein [Nicotiana tomentosiformis]|uniref:uncharacterized protein n=1 Tax=Nicotiana tomentosiformis TaxID=4098 RepID=UPI00388C6CA9